MHIGVLLQRFYQYCGLLPYGMGAQQVVLSSALLTVKTARIEPCACSLLRLTLSAVNLRYLNHCHSRLSCHDAPVASLVTQDFYQALYTQSQAQFDTYVGSGTILNNYAHIFDVSRGIGFPAGCHFIVNRAVGRLPTGPHQ